MKKVAVIQSNYIPWKGYFDIINDVDLFIFYDDVQYTKNDWRNRNRIKSPQGTQWLTIPTGSHNDKLICEVTIDDKHWAKKHFNTLQANYSKAPYYKKYKDFFEYIYLEKTWVNLSDLNQYLIQVITHDFLGSNVQFSDSRKFELTGEKLERLINLLKLAEANVYVSGPAAKSYIIDQKFDDAGIELVYKNYLGYPAYSQAHPPFDHYVSILDLLFNTGSDAAHYIWGWRQL
ncbi:hypothetical protein QJ48_09185 [Paenibacillus sp. A3]|uniref:WbqC family protein n=1 Tax=Paenibacillus sp. A3 TaxID=1337054 RepID=UPI0006D59E8E|nr:WbqC family protein [Paenibacillus sp. A3]KPV59755.1 hypothetical protein QJ48_09185 [Paenibacillus sp. A3]